MMKKGSIERCKLLLVAFIILRRRLFITAPRCTVEYRSVEKISFRRRQRGSESAGMTIRTAAALSVQGVSIAVLKR